MGMFDFVKEAGRKLGLGKDEPPKPEDLKQEVSKLGLDTKGLDVKV